MGGENGAACVCPLALAEAAAALAESVRGLGLALGISKTHRQGDYSHLVAARRGKNDLVAMAWTASGAVGNQNNHYRCRSAATANSSSLSLENQNSLSDYLRGKKQLADIIVRDRVTAADIMAASDPGKVFDLLNGARMKELVAILRKNTNSSLSIHRPALPYRISRALAALSDQVLYAVAWDRTSREVVSGGARLSRDVENRCPSF